MGNAGGLCVTEMFWANVFPSRMYNCTLRSELLGHQAMVVKILMNDDINLRRTTVRDARITTDTDIKYQINTPHTKGTTPIYLS